MYDTFPCMTLFFVAGIPLFAVFFLVTVYSNTFDPRMIFREAGKGVLCFFPSILVYIFIEMFFPTVYAGRPLYLTRTVLDLFLPLILSTAAYLIMYRRDLILPGDYQFLRFLSFATGFFVSFSVFSLVNFRGWYDGYQFFLLPLLWMALLLCAGYCLGVFFSQGGWLRFVFLFVALAFPFLFGFVPYLYIASRYFFAWALTIFLFGGIFFLFFKGLLNLK